MNNNGALYIQYHDTAAVASLISDYMQQIGFQTSAHRPGESLGRIFIPEKLRRLFYLVPPQNGWITIWEDPRYFGDRFLAQYLAQKLDTRAVWIEVAGNGVAWAHGIYNGSETVEEHLDLTETTFYGEYGTLHFAFDVDLSRLPDDIISDLELPFDELHYEAVLEGELPAEAGPALHLAFEKPQV
jgi:hypothetical protein